MSRWRLIFRYLKQHAWESLLIIVMMSIGIAVLTTVLVSYFALQQQLHTHLQGDYYRLFSVTGQDSQNTINLRAEPPIRSEGAWEGPGLDLSITDLEKIQNSLPQGMYVFYTESARFTPQLTRELNLNVIGTSKGFNEFNQFPLLTGEWFVDEDIDQGNSVLIVSAELATDLFGAENVPGQTISFERRGVPCAYTIIGVLEPGVGEYHTVYVPLGSPLFLDTNLRSFFVGIDSTLNPVQALEEIQGNVHLHLGEGAYVQNNLLQLQEELAIMQPILRNIALFASVGLVIAVINILNLMLKRALRRVKHAGISMALGSSRLEIFLQFLGEAIILGVISAFFGVAISYLAEIWLDNTLSIGVYPVPMVLRLLISIGIGGTSSLLFGFYPASQIMRMDLGQALRTDTGGS